MVINIFYLIGCIIFLYNLIMMPKLQKTLMSVEWLTLYKLRKMVVNPARVEYSLIYHWIAASVLSSVWLFCGIFFSKSILFTYLFILNVLSNYLLSRNHGHLKIKLSIIKSVVYNFILAILIVCYLFSI